MKPEPGLQPPSMAFAFSATSRHDRKLQSKSPSPDVGARRRLSPKSKTPAQDFMSIETNHAPPRQDFLSRRGPISCNTSEWSWGESNPRPPSENCPRYDHSRVLRLNGCLTAGSGGAETPPPGLSPKSAFFHAVSLLSGCHPLLLLPGCSELAPCAIAGHDFSLQGLSYQAARVNCSSAVDLLPLFKESEATLVARSSLRSQRRNRSAP